MYAYIYISIVRDRDGEESGGRQGDREMETDRLIHMYAENEDFFFSNSEIRWNLSLRISEIPACQYERKKMEGWRISYQLRNRYP